jgi:predicted YcjX-like family ATPase
MKPSYGKWRLKTKKEEIMDYYCFRKYVRHEELKEYIAKFDEEIRLMELLSASEAVLQELKQMKEELTEGK